MGVPSLELFDGGVPRYSRPIQLQLRVLYWILNAHLGHTLILLTLDRGVLTLTLSCLLLLGGKPFLLKDQLPFLSHLLLLLPLLQVGRSIVKWRRRRRRRRRMGKRKKRLRPRDVLGRRPLGLIREEFTQTSLPIQSISSSSSELLSLNVMMRSEVRTPENLSGLSSEFET